MTTPDLPAFAPLFAHQLHQLRAATQAALHQFQALFEPWIAHHRLAQQDDGPHSRDRCWNLRLVFWTFLWQIAQAGASCREAIDQARDLCLLQRRPQPPDTASPYCQARGQLPLQRLDDIHQAVVTQAEAASASRDLWCGLRVHVVDGTTLSAPDTPANQKAFPQQKGQRPGCGFPILRLVAFFALATGLISGWIHGAYGQSELALLQHLWDTLRPGELLLGDRGFCTWGLLAQCQARQVHAVFRVRGSRRRDFRRGKRLSRDQREVHWAKPTLRPRTVTGQEWDRLPDSLCLRLARCRVNVRGFRTRQVILVTTLLDRDAYPLDALSELYLRRWEMELTLRHLKVTLQMDQLSCKTPDNLAREIRLHLLMHNLVRRVMLEAARRHRAPLNRLSFAGALAACRRCGEALLQARSQRQRQQLLHQLFGGIATDLLPDRPGRREPRAIKRRPKPYPLLTRHRSQFKEIQHQNRYYKNSPYAGKYRKSSRA
jgi:hypothetical protein